MHACSLFSEEGRCCRQQGRSFPYHLVSNEDTSLLIDANLNPENSRSERIIRAFSPVRMNIFFAGCPDRAHTLATMETIIQTTNLWDLDLYGYVTYLLKKMTKLRSLNANSVDYSQFLPWNLTPKLPEEMDVHSISIKKKRR